MQKKNEKMNYYEYINMFLEENLKEYIEYSKGFLDKKTKEREEKEIESNKVL